MATERARARPARTAVEVEIGGYARYDARRGHRTGAPEVVLGEGKTVAHLLGILTGLAARRHGAVVSRLTPAQRRAVLLAGARGLPVRLLADGRLARLEGPIAGAPVPGVVAVLSAGTADVPAAEEAAGLLEVLGVTVLRRYDVGLAGIHRLARALASIERKAPAVYLVFAGREGALPTVVAGLVRAPVVGVPTSVGYGRGGRGEAALSAMLQSCAPIAVVNIDAAVPAALFALQLLGRPVGSRRR